MGIYYTVLLCKFEIFHNWKVIFPLPRNSTPRYLHKRNENLGPEKYLYKSVHISFILRAENWKQSIIRKWINRLVYSYNEILLLGDKKEWIADTCYNIGEFQNHAKWKKLCMKKHIVWFNLYI